MKKQLSFTTGDERIQDIVYSHHSMCCIYRILQPQSSTASPTIIFYSALLPKKTNRTFYMEVNHRP